MKARTMTPPPQLLRAAHRARTRWLAMSVRERMLLAAVAIAALAALYDLAVLQPVQRQRRILQQGIESAEAQAATLSGRLGDGGTGIAERTARAQQALAQADAELASIKGGITPPAQMAERLRTLLASARNLTVVALRNLPAQGAGGESLARAPGGPPTAQSADPGTSAAPAPMSAKGAGLYRHPIEIRLLGRYADIVAWLERLEADADDLHVTELSLELRPSGRIEARIGLYTLGAEPVWLTL